MSIERQESFDQPTLWNCFCLSTPKTNPFLSPCSKTVFLVTSKRSCGVLAHFFISSCVLIFYSCRPAQLTDHYSKQPSSHHHFTTAESFSGDVLRVWLQGGCHLLSWVKALVCTLEMQEPYTCAKRCSACWPSNKPRWHHRANTLFTISKRRETPGFNNSCPWCWSDVLVALLQTRPLAHNMNKIQDSENYNSLQSRFKERCWKWK